jgi:TolB-like protein
MYQVDPYLKEVDFPADKIRQQLEKMLLDPLFSKSPILKRFLTFIVYEKLAGRSNCLKEYTIGLNILNKPKDFNPQENGIIRIHAGRLRQALAHYYNTQGTHDEIRISLSKGNYVPVFSENADYFMRSALDDQQKQFYGAFTSGNTVIASVMPFHFMERKGFIKNFADGLGGQLSNSLGKVNNFSVISYNAVRLISGKLSGVKEVATVFGAHYVFTGEIHCQKNMVRITIEMFRADTGEQVWSQLFERKITPENIFEVQDDIIKHVLDELQRPGVLTLDKTKSADMMAVA